MKKIDELINRFQEYRDELNKNAPQSSHVIKAEAIKFEKNGQWSLDKSDFSGPTARALAAKHPMKPSAPAVGKEYSGPAARALAAKHPVSSAPGAHAIKQNSILDARRANALKSESEEQDNKDAAAKILRPHPKSGNHGVVPIPAAGRVSIEENERAGAKTKTINKVDPEENVNIAHPQKAPKMAQDPKHACKKCGKGPCECRG